MIMHNVTIGPAVPCSKRPRSRIGTLGANAATLQPATVAISMPSKTFLRPTKSAKRGRNSENNADEVKNTVCERPICVAVVFSSFCMVTNAGESMEALSWNANVAVRNATIRKATDFPFLAGCEAWGLTVISLMSKPHFFDIHCHFKLLC